MQGLGTSFLMAGEPAGGTAEIDRKPNQKLVIERATDCIEMLCADVDGNARGELIFNTFEE